MIPLNAAIVSEVVNKTGPRKLSGRGTVERKTDASTYVLRLAAGKMTVQLADGALAEGDNVVVTRNGGRVSIEKVTAAPQQVSQQVRRDSVEVLPENARNEPSQVVNAVLGKTASELADQQTIEKLNAVLQVVGNARGEFDARVQIDLAHFAKAAEKVASADSPENVPPESRVLDLAVELRRLVTDAPAAKDISAEKPVVQLDRSVEPAVYQFDSADRALQWLEARSAEVPEEVKEAIAQTPRGERIYLKVVEQAPNDFRAVLTSAREVIEEVQLSIDNNTRSQTAKDVPVDKIVAAARSQGSFDVAQVRALDAVLVVVEKGGDDAPRLAVRALEIIWPSMLFEHAQHEAGAVTRVPDTPPTDIAFTTEQLGAFAQQLLHDVKDDLSPKSFEYLETAVDILQEVNAHPSVEVQKALLDSAESSSSAVPKATLHSSPELVDKLVAHVFRLHQAVEYAGDSPDSAVKIVSPQADMPQPAPPEDVSRLIEFLFRFTRSEGGSERVPPATLQQDAGRIVMDNASNGTSATAVPIEQAEGSSAHVLNAQMRSSTMRSLPPSVLSVAVVRQGGVDVSTLLTLDAILFAMESRDEGVSHDTGRMMADIAQQVRHVAEHAAAQPTDTPPPHPAEGAEQHDTAQTRPAPPSPVDQILALADTLAQVGREQGQAPEKTAAIEVVLSMIAGAHPETADKVLEAFGQPMPPPTEAVAESSSQEPKPAAAANETNRFLEALFRLHGAVSDRPEASAPPRPAGVHSVEITKPTDSGLYRFESTKEALAWLSQKGEVPAAVQEQLAENQPDREVFVRVHTSSDGQAKAQIISRPEAVRHIERMVADETYSDTLRRVPAPVMADALEREGSLEVSKLRAIDAILQAMQSNGKEAVEPAVLSRALSVAWPQLLSEKIAALIAQSGGATAASNLLPGYTTEDIGSFVTQLLEQVRSMSSLSDVVQKLESIQRMLGSESFTASQSMTSLVERLREVLSEISRGESLADHDLNARLRGLTTQLYDSLDGAQGTSLQQHGGARTVSLHAPVPPSLMHFQTVARAVEWFSAHGDLSDQVKTELMHAAGENGVYVRIQQTGNGAEAVMLRPEELHAELEHIVRNELNSPLLKQLDPRHLAQIIRQNGILPLERLNGLDAMLMAHNSAQTSAQPLTQQALDMSLPQWAGVGLDSDSPLPAHFAEALSKAGANLPSTLTNIFEEMGLEPTVNSEQYAVQQESLANSTNRGDYLLNLLRGLGFNFENELSNSGQAPGGGAEPGAQQSPIEMSMKLALLSLLRYVAEGGEQENEVGGRQGAGQGEQAQESRLGQLGAQQPGAEREQSESQARQFGMGVRQQVETALNRLESLQLLSKPTTTSEGEQRVMVIPMHIDGEWAEARLQLVKKYRQGKDPGKAPTQFALTLNVNPTFLGEIAIRIDYAKGKNLAVNLAFAKAGARKWFQERRKDIADALERIGIKSISVDTHNLHDGGAAPAGEKKRKGKAGGALELWG